MAQRTKRIALDRTYLPIDPNALPETMHDTGGEDKPEDRIPVMPFEGWNFMPTSYGWRSYFGITAALNIDALPVAASTCRDIFVFQKDDLTNKIVALCDDGIYTKDGESVGAWTKEIALTAPGAGVLKEWSKVILENVLYVYRQGEANAYKCASPGFAFVAHTPNTLNMAGQLGIFKAGNRLGFWDSADSIAVSALKDFTDFAPSIATLANIFTLKDKIGKIINILQHGDGWIVYATKSILAVQRDLSNSFQWKATPISNVAGISYRNQVCVGAPDTEHFAWTSIGLMRIRNFQVEIIAPELYDFIDEAQIPVYLRMLEGRYLAVQLSDASYVDGLISFSQVTIDPLTITLAEIPAVWAAIPDYTITASLDDTDAGTIFALFSSQPGGTGVESEEGGCGPAPFCVGKDYGVYEDHFVCPVTPEASLGGILKLPVFDSAPFIINIGANAQPIGELETSLNAVPVVNKDYAGTIIIDYPNERNFYEKVTAIWAKYESYLTNYRTQLKNQLYAISPLALTNATDPNASSFSKVNVSASYPVPLGDYGASLPRGAKEIYPTATAPITIAGMNVDAYAGRLPYAYELEYGKVGYTFYSIAKPTREMNYTGSLQRRTSFLANFYQVNILGGTGAAAGITTGIQVTGGDMTTVLAGIGDFLSGEGFTSDGVNTITGIITAYFVQNGAVTNQAGFTGLTVKDNTGAAWAPTGSQGVVCTLDVHETGVPANTGTVQFNMQARDLQAYDQFTSTFSDVVHPDTYCTREEFVSYTHPISFYQYTLYGGIIASPNSPPAYSAAAVAAASLCGEGLEARPRPTLFSMSMSSPLGWLPPINVEINNIPFLISAAETITFTYPGATFLMQSGDAAPSDVEWKGAYVYDSHLQRWGKMKHDYRQLLDFSPLNSTSVGVIPFTNFGVQGALLDSSGIIRLFDAKPADSFLKFGKYGNFRHGYTSLEMIRADFRQPCTGEIVVEPSFDGKSVDSTNTKTYGYADATQIVQGHDISARWHNIAFKGQFDLSYLELTSWSASRR